MPWIRCIVLILAAALLQTNLIHLIAVTSLEIQPNLLIILLVFFSIYGSSYDAIITSFLIGLFADLIGETMGPHMLAFGVLGSVLAQLRQLVALDRFILQSVAIFLVGLSSSGLVILLYPIKGYVASYTLGQTLFWNPLYSSVLGPLLFIPIRLFMGMKQARRPAPFSQKG